jgi:5'-3' exonuclease
MVALIDGDVLAYKASEARWKTRYSDKDLIPVDAEGKKIPLVYTAEEDAEYQLTVWLRFVELVEMYLEKLYCRDYMMAVGSQDNFRTLLYEDYKFHRKPSEVAPFVRACRKRAVEEGMAVEAVGREADDMLRIWSEECRSAGKDFIVVSIDKDLLMIPGRHYRIHKDTVVEVSEEDARRNYYEQLLKGDPTDNIPGLPKIGDVKAKRLLEQSHTEEEMQDVVIEQYMDKFGDDWEQQLLINGKLIHIQRSPDDYFNIKNWPLIREIR